MLIKQIYDLTKSDLEKFPIWYFPMDESVEDELSITPFLDESAIDSDFQMIVKTDFSDAQGGKYVGYIYWRKSNVISQCLPTLFVDENNCLSFWNGIITPKWEKEGVKQQLLRKVLPISFESKEFKGLEAVKGELLGLYYFDENRKTLYVE